MGAQAEFDAAIAPLRAEPGVEEGRAFHAPAFTVGGRIFAMLVDDSLVVKLSPERCRELAATRGAEPFRSGRRVMKAWISVGDPEAGDWGALAREAMEFVGGLP